MRSTIAIILACSWLCACSEHGQTGSSGPGADEATPSTPYRLGQALVIGHTAGGELVSVQDGCDSAACQAVIDRCGERAYADVVVDADGSVLDVLCFPGNAKLVAIGPGAVATASAGNDTVLVLDGLSDGADVTGDVVLAGNNAVVYGEGADVSQIGGDLAIDKNNAIVRGVDIRGDVTISKNNAQLSFTEIHGDLTIDGNNTTLAECVVHGQVHINGVNTVLVQNRFQGARTLEGKNLTCNGNVTFEATPAHPESGDAGADAGTGSNNAGDAGAPSALTCERSNGPASHRGQP